MASCFAPYLIKSNWLYIGRGSAAEGGANLFATNSVRLHPMDGQRFALDRQWMGSHGRWRDAKRLRHQMIYISTDRKIS